MLGASSKVHGSPPIKIHQFTVLPWLAWGLLACSPETPVDDSPNVAGDSNDYLSSAMRVEVESLKADVVSNPTDQSTIATRARLLADWIDAYALAGGEVGVDPTRIRAQATTPPRGNAAVVQSRRLDMFVREFSLREEEGALGFLSSDTLGPHEAGSMGTLRQTWRVGTRPMETGGGFWVARHFAANYGQFQAIDPAAPGYISITSNDDDAVFEPVTIMASGPHGGFRAPQPAISFQLVEGVLDRGSSVTITYGDTSAGGPGLRIPTFQSERMPFPIYIDLDGSEEWRPLDITPFIVAGGTVTRVHGFGPSVVEPNETFEFSVRAEDQYYNRATGEIPAFEVLFNDEVVATTPAGSGAVNVVELSIAEPGVQWVSLRSADGRIVGKANPILVEASPQQRIYWGDTHAHSGYSEGIGTVKQFMEYARDDARLDFVTHSEHDIWLDAGEWALIRKATADYDQPGKFITYLGWEWTRHTRFGGHHNVLFRDIEDQVPVSSLEYPVLSSLYAELHARHNANDVVVIPHAHNPGDYRQSDPQLEPLVEMMSQHGNFQWFMEQYLAHGQQVGVVAASDDHLSRPGYSPTHRDSLAQWGGLGAVMAPERSRDAIFDGMKNRRTYATTGERIIVQFDVNGANMGERTAFAESREISGRVIGTEAIRSITLFKNNEPLWHEEYLINDNPGTDQELLLSFDSSEVPHFNNDVPRGWRHWLGELVIEGASLDGAAPMDFINPGTQFFETDSNSIRFRTHTRGDTSSILLNLSEVSNDASITINLFETRESGSAPPIYRQHQTIPGTSVSLALADITDGQLRQQIPQTDYPDDGVTLRRVINGGDKDISFSIIDADNPDHGDYYYIRVEQVNDALAWSSPIWVGGLPSR